jgi:uncharacterized damage-inducible protein DinB
MFLAHIHDLYEYNAWANRRTLDAVTVLSTEQFVKSLGSSFGSVRETLTHVCDAEWVWLERFLGNTPAAFPEKDRFADLVELRAHWLQQEPRLLSYVHGLTESDLGENFEYSTFSYGPAQNPLHQSLAHVANHGTYHRGQVATMLRQLGAKPVATDFMLYYREQAAASANA